MRTSGTNVPNGQAPRREGDRGAERRITRRGCARHGRETGGEVISYQHPNRTRNEGESSEGLLARVRTLSGALTGNENRQPRCRCERASPLGTLTEGTPHRSGKGVAQVQAERGPARVRPMEALDVMRNRTKVKRRVRRILRGELAPSSDARYPSGRMRRGDGFASKFRAPYPGSSVGLHRRNSSGSWK